MLSGAHRSCVLWTNWTTVLHGLLIAQPASSCHLAHQGIACVLQADQIRQTLEEYRSNGVWGLVADAGGNPTILFGTNDVPR